MKWIIVLFGLLIALLAGLLAARPRELGDYMVKNAGQRWFQGIAVVTRLLLGVALILYADASRYPFVLFVLGWVAVAAGIAMAVTPLARFEALVRWVFERFGRFLRAAALAAVLFGAFLVHAVV